MERVAQDLLGRFDQEERLGIPAVHRLRLRSVHACSFPTADACSTCDRRIFAVTYFASYFWIAPRRYWNSASGCKKRSESRSVTKASPARQSLWKRGSIGIDFSGFKEAKKYFILIGRPGSGIGVPAKRGLAAVEDEGVLRRTDPATHSLFVMPAASSRLCENRISADGHAAVDGESAPVIAEAAGEQSHEIVAATSTGSMRRPMGCCWANSSALESS